MIRSLIAAAAMAALISSGCGNGGRDAEPAASTPAPSPAATTPPLLSVGPGASPGTATQSPARPRSTEAPKTATPAPTGPPSFPDRTNSPVSKAPTAVLRSSGAEVEGMQGSSCWKGSPNQPALCVDTQPGEPQNVLTVKRGETITLYFTREGGPSSINAQRYDQAGWQNGRELAVVATNPTTFKADFETGTRWLSFFTKWTEGDVVHYFKLQVT